MRTLRFCVATALAIVLASQSVAHARVGVSVGIGLGFPVYYRPCYGPGYYYRPYPVYVAPAPLVVQPVPVAQPVAVVQPVQPVYQAPAPTPVPVQSAAPAPAAAAPVVARSVSSQEPPANVEYYLDQLRAANERSRADGALQLGRMKSRRAVEPLTQLMANDQSPAVRDSAARALGLIGDTSALNALQNAAQADNDRDVRHSASFAAEILRANLRGQ